MTINTKAKIELGLNIIVVVAIITVTALVVKRYVFQGAQQQPRIKIGSQLNVANVDWERNKKTLVFFLMEKCAYCESSAPFYRQLIEDAARFNVKSLAILPLPVERGRTYVESLKLPIEDVQTGLLRSYQVPGTPTVAFVDDHGTVRGVWIGAAPREREKEMQQELNALF